ncbi:OB-fold domain-containing protein [Candidimonas humi]|uniref:Zn-ribbon domain-containing OB-fold protein n=1 Tax=Candidimonas humi TaxID=683355 RepID=A0ABV8NYD6_9BURK|nr:OB-fold domain-containing protein [Candidimonas humi]MBV6305594.1 OB-fold domain-containing protein [Candidimonas humi]
MKTLIKLPALDFDNQAFWTSGRTGSLRICFCAACGRYQHPPLPVCPNCGSLDVEHRPVSGQGEVITYTVNWQPWSTGQEVPFVLAIVELVEQKGLWLMTNIVQCPVEDVHIGMPVSIGFIHREDVWLPVFKPQEEK